MITFLVGVLVGTFVGIAMVALVSVNRFEEDDDETDRHR